MNTNLVSIVKQIIAGHGETILAEPQRLKAFFGDLAKDEPKPLRLAFGRCIEAGAYNALKTAHDTAERAERKTAIAQRLRNDQGLDITLCAEALDILEAALYGTTRSQAAYQQPNPVPAQSAAWQQPAYQQTAPYTAPAAPKRTLRNVLIAAAVLAAVIVLIALRVPDVNISISPWRGYPTFESFSHAMQIDQREKPITEESFKATMSLLAFAYYLSGDKLADTLKIANALTNEDAKIDSLDIVNGKALTEQYGVSEALRKDNNYLLKQDIMKSAAQFAYFNGDAWVVLSVSAKQK
jgi:hypothetical protein